MRRRGRGLALIGGILQFFFEHGRASVCFTTGCTPPCTYYVQTGVEDCFSCSSGYALSQRRCVACPANCNTCYFTGDPPVQYCTACNSGYGVSSTFTCAPCESTCSTCQYRERINGLFFNKMYCTECKSGYYRSPDPLSSHTCLTCSACSVGQYKYANCMTNYNTGCSECSAGQRVVGETSCQNCDPGTFVTSNRLECQTCSTCQAPRYIPTGGACTTEHDTVCNDCPNNKASSGSDQATCTTCSSGYFRTQSGSDFTCTSCTSVSCGTNQWINCAGAVRVCTDCAGSKTSNACNAGYASDKTCDGTSLTGSTCVLCGPGSERLSAGLPLACSKCDTGKYKDAAIVSLGGVRNCAACTNRPANNSVYTVWGMSEPISSNCPWCVLVFLLLFWFGLL